MLAIDYSNFLNLEQDKPYLNYLCSSRREEKKQLTSVLRLKTKRIHVNLKGKRLGLSRPFCFFYLCHLTWASYPITFIFLFFILFIYLFFILGPNQFNPFNCRLPNNLPKIIELVSKLWGVTRIKW